MRLTSDFLYMIWNRCKVSTALTRRWWPFQVHDSLKGAFLLPKDIISMQIKIKSNKQSDTTFVTERLLSKRTRQVQKIP